jgi:hypothetical protein
MNLDITKPEGMLRLQGAKVLVRCDREEAVLTVVRVMAVRQRLELVNKESREREAYALTQELCDQLQPCSDKRAQWSLTLRCHPNK